LIHYSIISLYCEIISQMPANLISRNLNVPACMGKAG
jgi:hypothetical protein